MFLFAVTPAWLLTRSLVPAIAVHAAVDVGSRALLWVALRDRAPLAPTGLHTVGSEISRPPTI